MSFQEKMTWAVLAAMVVVYGFYFAVVATALAGTPAEEIGYQFVMVLTVVALVIVLAVAAIIAAATGDGDDGSDERDKSINRFGEYVGGYVLGAGVLVGLGLAMLEFNQFWIANALLLALVLSEITSAVTKVVLYRRGTVAW